MYKMTTIFRILIVISTILYVVVYWLPYLEEPFLSEKEMQLLIWDGLGSLFRVSLALDIGIFLTGIVVPALMFFYVAGSRLAFLVLTLLYIALNLAFGIRVFTPITLFLGDIVLVMDGAIIAISYFTSVSERFNF